MFKKKVDPLDVETEFLMKLAGVITQSAHSVAQNWTRAAVIFNQVFSSEGALTGTVVCPFIVADGQRFQGKWLADEHGQEMMRVVEEWQKSMIELGDRKYTAWTALFFGVTNEGGQYSFTSINEDDPSYGKWRISDNGEVNWWALRRCSTAVARPSISDNRSYSYRSASIGLSLAALFAG